MPRCVQDRPSIAVRNLREQLGQCGGPLEKSSPRFLFLCKADTRDKIVNIQEKIEKKMNEVWVLSAAGYADGQTNTTLKKVRALTKAATALYQQWHVGIPIYATGY